MRTWRLGLRRRCGSPSKNGSVRLSADAEFLRELHNSNVLDLYVIAGRFTNCRGKAVWEQSEGEVAYTGTRTTVTKTDLDYFLEFGPTAVPSFTVYPISRDVFLNRRGYLI